MAQFFRNKLGTVQSVNDGDELPEGATVLTEAEAAGENPALLGYERAPEAAPEAASEAASEAAPEAEGAAATGEGA